jgi:miniconductance mechanosensitive channel
MDNLRNEFREFLYTWLQSHFPSYATTTYNVLVIAWIVVFALVLYLLLHVLVLRQIVRLRAKDPKRWQQALYSRSLYTRIAYMLQAAVVHIQVGLWLDETSFLRHFIETGVDLWLLLFGLLAFFSLLDAFQGLMSRRAQELHFPLRGVVQTVKLLASVVITVVGVSILMGESPIILLSGLGALSAVLMLIFRDPILGLVAGIQLSVNDMLSIGDWLEMPKYEADGDVIDIGLTTVKVQNWDKTITTIPTYALISDSFKNWRGMSNAGGRRIKRSLLIDTSSIRFLNDEDMQRLKRAHLLEPYLTEKFSEVEESNRKAKSDMTSLINGRRLTNIGTFRGYLVSYLQNHLFINQGMTLMVRQLEPTKDGLPLQIYGFTNTTKWGEYESIQSDIFDNVFAVLPEFGLRAHESPTGADVRSLRGLAEETSL